MNLRKKILGITLLVIFVAIAAFYTIVSPIVMNGFEQVEDDSIRRNTQRATDALQANISSISSKLQDWAIWDDAYDFVQKKNPTFIETNLSEDVTNPIFDSQLYFDRTGKLLYVFDQTKRPSDLVSIIQDSGLLKYGSIMPESGKTYGNQGIVVSNGTLVLLAAQPIFDTNSSKQAAGTLVFTKYLGDQDVSAISKQTHLDVSLYSITAASNPRDVKEALSTLRPNTIAIQKPTDHLASGYSLVKDINGKPAVVARVQTNRAIYQQGLNSTFLLRSTLIGFAAVLLVILYIALNLIVVRRLMRLSKEVSKIKGDRSHVHYVNFPGRDEVSILASSINSMVDRIKGSDDKVHDLVNELQSEKASIEQVVDERTKELHAQRDRFFFSITSLPLGFMLTDGGGKILMTNAALSTLLTIKSTSLEDLEKHSKEEISPLHELLVEANRAAYTRKTIQKEIKTPEGKFLHASIAPVISNSDDLEGVVVLIDDVTEAKILTRSRDEFFSIASHELRTPLTAIRGNTQMIQDFYGEQLKDDSLREMIDDIHISSVRLIEIVNDFLDASSLEQGKMMLKNEEFAPAPIVTKVIDEMAVTAAEKKLSLQANSTIKDMPRVKGDPDKVKQIIYNLIGNAMKFTEKGGVTISAELIENDRKVKILVTDTGPGISPEGQQLLFRKFQQTNESLHTRDRTRGTGLGLYISLLLAKKMGGNLTLEKSEVGLGSTFSFTIPVA